MKFKYYHFILFWFLLNLFQAATTELTSDEGYYWFYASQLDWGFYDHPPLLALLIKLGSAIFSSELGVRLFNIVLISLSLFPFLKLFPERVLKEKTIYIALLAFPLFNYITFIAFPDSPLIAFSVLFLWAYKRFLERKDWFSTIVMGIALALMLYAKYHAVLLVPIVLISNWRLLKNLKFYVFVALSVVLYIPHLLWQIEHDFVSFTYHLKGRARTFKFDYITQYITQQIVVIGPFIVLAFLYKVKTQFDKTLKYLIIGIFGFFLLMSIRGFVHLHWTSLAIFPLLILTVRYVSEKNKQRIFLRIGIPFALLILMFRLYLSFHIFPFNNLNVDYYHDRALWAEDIEQIAYNRPVIFEKQLREAPLYSFYSQDKEGVALYPGIGKKSEYEIRNYEDQLQGKDVLVVKDKPFPKSTALITRMGKEVHYLEVDELNSFLNIKTEIKSQEIKNGRHIFELAIKNHRNRELVFDNVSLLIHTINADNEVKNHFLSKLNFTIQSNSSKEIIAKIALEKFSENERYDAYFYFMDGICFSSITSEKIQIQTP